MEAAIQGWPQFSSAQLQRLCFRSKREPIINKLEDPLVACDQTDWIWGAGARRENNSTRDINMTLFDISPPPTPTPFFLNTFSGNNTIEAKTLTKCDVAYLSNLTAGSRRFSAASLLVFNSGRTKVLLYLFILSEKKCHPFDRSGRFPFLNFSGCLRSI